ncbi:hypothetical protein L3X38_015299 [Prunus dulcis]|uniref:Uncharacterized protein n=1 Tax=Prunus dulcis TaxID=3755 RepID=A0AAD4WPV6_PRUDU|nr:hypothetical protein L3X38_015299 [Prunus dulcis]
MGLGCGQEQLDGLGPVFEFNYQAPRVHQKDRGALGNTLASFTNKTNSCLQINIMAWHEKLVAWELSIHEFSMRERIPGFPMRNREVRGDACSLYGCVYGKERKKIEEQSMKLDLPATGKDVSCPRSVCQRRKRKEMEE